MHSATVDIELPIPYKFLEEFKKKQEEVDLINVDRDKPWKVSLDPLHRQEQWKELTRDRNSKIPEAIKLTESLMKGWKRKNEHIGLFYSFDGTKYKYQTYWER